MVRVAVAGIGFMGKTHLGVYQRLAGVEVVALYRRNPVTESYIDLAAGGNIDASGGRFDLAATRVYSEYEQMLHNGGFDFVDVCSPTHLHTEQAVQALEAGYHVFCEKPLALNLQDARRIVRTAKKAGKLLGVGMCLRYWPAFVEIKRILDSKIYGGVKYAEFARFSYPPGWSKGGWQHDQEKSGGAALDLHIHDADMVLYLFGKPLCVRSSAVRSAGGSMAHIATLYDYDDLVVQATGGWMCSDSYGFNMRAFFVLEQACIELDFSKSPPATVYPDGKESYALAYPEGDGYYYELKDFAESVQCGRLSGMVTPESAVDSLALCLAEIQSAGERAEIKL